MILGLGKSLGEGNGYPLQYPCLENPMDRGTWQATVHGVPKSQTQLSDFIFFSLIYYFNIVTACNVSNIQLYLHFHDCRDSNMCQCQKDLLKVRTHVSSMCQLLRCPTVQSSEFESGRREMHFRRHTRRATGHKREKVQYFCLYVLFLFLLGKLNYHIQMNGTGPLSYTNINSKWIIDSNTE